MCGGGLGQAGGGGARGVCKSGCGEARSCGMGAALTPVERYRWAVFVYGVALKIWRMQSAALV